MRIVSLADVPSVGLSHDPGIRKQVLLRRGDLPHLTQLARSRLAPGQVAGAHAHADMVEVFLVEAGEGTIRIDGRVHPLVPGVCVAVEPGEAHELASTGAADLMLTYLGIEV